MAFSSLFSSNLVEAYINLIMFILYFLFAILAFRINWTPQDIQRLLICFMVGGFLSSALTIIDWFGLVDIPRVNEVSVGTRTDSGYIMQASGPFTRRSAMAAYSTLLIPIPVLLLLNSKQNMRGKLLLLIALTSFVISLLLTHNRAGFVGALIASVLINFSLIRSPIKLLQIILFSLIITTFFTWIMTTFFYEQLAVYQSLFGIGDTALRDQFHEESDHLRIVFLQHAIASIVDNPVGYGYTLLTGVTGFEYRGVDPHSNITQIIWATGFFGIGWIVYFGTNLFYQSRLVFSRKNKNNPYTLYGTVLIASLLGWFFCSFAHTIIGTGMAWLLFGILLKIFKTLQSANSIIQ